MVASKTKKKKAAPVSGIDKEAYARTLGVDPDTEPDVFEFLSKAFYHPLPEPWTEHADKKGRVFYWNPVSRESSWAHPLATTHKTLVASYRRIIQAEDPVGAVSEEIQSYHQQAEEEISSWRQSHAPDGTPYYYKVGTQSTRWDNPRDELLGHMELRIRMLTEFADVREPPAAEQELPVEAEEGQMPALPAMELSPAREIEEYGDLANARAACGGSPRFAGGRPLEVDTERKQHWNRKAPEGLELQDDHSEGKVPDAGTPPTPTEQQRNPLAPPPKQSGSMSPKKFVRSVTDHFSKRGLSPGRSRPETPLDAEQKSSQRKGRGNRTGNEDEPLALEDKSVSGRLQSPLSPQRSRTSNLNTSGSSWFSMSGKKQARQQAALEAKQAESALKLGRAARRWLHRRHIEKSEAMIAVQKHVRGFLVRRRMDRMRRRGQTWGDNLPRELTMLGKRPPTQGAETAATTQEMEPATILPAEAASLYDIMMSSYPVRGRFNFNQTGDKSITGMLDGDMLLTGKVSNMEDCVVPDELALHLGMNFDDPMALAAFGIMKPLFLRPLPMPWQVLRRKTGRADFYHPGLKEVRKRHPMFGFFQEVLTFLQENVQTNMPIIEPLTAQIFRETSPQAVRARLGVWEGPHMDPKVSGKVRFLLLLPGEDEACCEAVERHDDPRLEAAANAALRLSGWHHLWQGFTPQEPFPLLEGRLKALASQLSESVVVAPGPAAEALLNQIAGGVPPAAQPKAEEKPLTKLEEMLQPMVTGMLGTAYGKALAEVAEAERSALRKEAGEEESDDAYTEIEEEEEDFEEMSEEEESTEEESYEDMKKEEDDEEDGSYSSEGSDDEKAEEDDDEGEAKASEFASSTRALDVTGLMPEGTGLEEEPQDIEPFIPTLKTESAAEWAARALRPLTPTKERDLKLEPGGVVAPTLMRHRHGFDQHIWSALASKADKEHKFEALAPETAAAVQASVDAAEKRPPTAQERVSIPPLMPGYLKPVHEAITLSPSPTNKAVNDFYKGLAVSSQFFDECTSAPSTDVPGWRKTQDGSITPPFSPREGLRKPGLKPTVHGAPTDDYAKVLPGCVAPVPSPAKGPHPPPPHLKGANPPREERVADPMWLGSRARSSSPTTSTRPGGPRQIPLKFQPAQRPDSAGPRARRPYEGAFPPPDNPAAVQAALSCRRFLSREVGTMQAALNTFDPNGDGYFTREEWEAGLAKLGYEPTCDVQEIFTVLDKRQHHVLTLSDLLDKYRGFSVWEGVTDPGIQGILGAIVSEVLDEQYAAVVSKAMAEVVEEELLNPRGPLAEPDVKRWLQERKRKRKGQKGGSPKPLSPPISAQAGGRADAAEDRSEQPEDVQEKVPVRKRMRGKFKIAGRVVGMTGRRQSPGSPASPSYGDGSKKSSESRILRRGGGDFDEEQRTPSASSSTRPKISAAARKLKGSRTPSPNQPGSRGSQGAAEDAEDPGPKARRGRLVASTRSTMMAKKYAGMLQKEGPLGTVAEDVESITLPEDFGQKRSADRMLKRMSDVQMSQMPFQSPSHRRSDVARFPQFEDMDAKKPAERQIDFGNTEEVDYSELSVKHDNRTLKKKTRSQPQLRGEYTNKFTGYSFVDNASFASASTEKEVIAARKEQRLPWAPRPTEDICKTYSHVFRLLHDPRIKRMQAGPGPMPQKRSVHVSVPRIPTSQNIDDDKLLDDDDMYLDGGGDSNGEATPSSTARGLAKDRWTSKSSPNLRSARSSEASPYGDEDGEGGNPDRLSLPPLSASSPSPTRSHPLGTAGLTSGIDAERGRQTALIGAA